MTPEHTLIALLFTAVLFFLLGSAWRLDTMLSRISSAAGEQVSSPWYGPQVLAGRIHADQDCVPDVGPLILSQTLSSRLLHYSVKAR